jgi:hypothetical protein
VPPPKTTSTFAPNGGFAGQEPRPPNADPVTLDGADTEADASASSALGFVAVWALPHAPARTAATMIADVVSVLRISTSLSFVHADHGGPVSRNHMPCRARL